MGPTSPQVVIFIPAGPAQLCTCSPGGFLHCSLKQLGFAEKQSQSPQNFGAETAAGRVKPWFSEGKGWDLGTGSHPTGVIHLIMK